MPANSSALAEQGKSAWRAPSNIAIVKYWGKRGAQIPANPSMSFTLSACHTTTSVAFERRKRADEDFEFLFDKKPNLLFADKIRVFFDRIRPYMPLLDHYRFEIESTNSFPHSSGIASSASAMSALALCFMSIERLNNPEMDDTFFYKKASFLARLGSGSACRSVLGRFVVWGCHPDFSQSTDFFGIALGDASVHKVFHDFRDTILVVSKGHKSVSSSLGHSLMSNHPFAEGRCNQAYKNLSELKHVLQTGDLEAFIAITELEALSLHAMMMTSHPYYMLLQPNTVAIIHAVWEFRKATKLNLCFTIDAGPNVHLLYPKKESDAILPFISQVLSTFGESYIEDGIGGGALSLL